MIMRITRCKLHPGAWSAFEQRYKATVAAQSEPIEGLRGRWLAQDISDPDTGYSVTLWDSLKTMRAYEQSDTYTWQMLPALQPFLREAYTTTSCMMKAIQAWEHDLEPSAVQSGGEP